MGHHVLCFLGALSHEHTCTYNWYFPGTPAKRPTVVQHVGQRRGGTREKEETKKIGERERERERKREREESENKLCFVLGFGAAQRGTVHFQGMLIL